MKRIFSFCGTSVALGLMWICAHLPFALCVRIGAATGVLASVLLPRRRAIAAKNLALCFPHMEAAEREKLLRQHFRLLGRSFIERGIVWWSSAARIRRLIKVEGAEQVDEWLDRGVPVILLAPHFMSLDIGGGRIAMHWDCVSIYTKQKNPLIDKLLYRGRTRFGDQRIFAREEGTRKPIRLLKSGRRVFYYLPDLDHGRAHSVFVPFFGVMAATLDALPKIARLTGARVVPCISRMHEDNSGYSVTLRPAWENFPSGDVDADVRRMNAWIEEEISHMPAQYYWVHRRFKTRPEGEDEKLY